MNPLNNMPYTVPQYYYYYCVDTFKELLIADLLPEERKLKTISQRPLHKLLLENGTCNYHLLLLWYYEEKLKEKYGEVLATLQVMIMV